MAHAASSVVARIDTGSIFLAKRMVSAYYKTRPAKKRRCKFRASLVTGSIKVARVSWHLRIAANGLRLLKSHFMKGIKMNKLIAALIAGLFAVSMNAFAADAAPKADAKPAVEAAAPAADAAKAEKPAAPTAKKAHKKGHKKAAEAKPAEAAK